MSIKKPPLSFKLILSYPLTVPIIKTIYSQ
jgi:hypothetical protein